MDNDILKLRKDAAEAEKNGRRGLRMNGMEKYARNPVQDFILTALLAGPVSVDSLTNQLRLRGGCTDADASPSLLLAEFILDFNEFLSSQ